jgi:hypothetical protein
MMKVKRKRGTNEVVLAVDDVEPTLYADVIMVECEEDEEHDTIELEDDFADFERKSKNLTGWNLGKYWIHDDGNVELEENVPNKRYTMAEALKELGYTDDDDKVNLRDLIKAQNLVNFGTPRENKKHNMTVKVKKKKKDKND